MSLKDEPLKQKEMEKDMGGGCCCLLVKGGKRGGRPRGLLYSGSSGGRCEV